MPEMTPLVCALLLDLDDATDFPGNEGSVFGRPLSAYPLMAARTSAHVRRIYAVTASPPVKAAALQYDAIIIDPPEGKEPDIQTFLLHGYRQIVQDMAKESSRPELMAVFLSNAPAVSKDMVDAGVEALLDHPELDSALSVAPNSRKTPFEARLETEDGLMAQFVTPPEARTGPFWYPTWGVTVLRPRCLESLSGSQPRPWLGRKVFPVKQWGPGPIDHHWQLSGLEFWLKKNGIPDLSPNLERQPMPKPQLAPKGDRR